MRSIGGPVTEIRDLGVVAEQCPYCERVMPCLLRSVCRGNYVFFIKTAAPTEENSCLCTVCLKALPCDHWRYATVVPLREAKALPVEDRGLSVFATNPCPMASEEALKTGSGSEDLFSQGVRK